MNRTMISLLTVAAVTAAATRSAHAAWPLVGWTLKTDGGSLDPDLPPPAEYKLATGRLRNIPLTKFRTYTDSVGTNVFGGGVWFSTNGCHVDTGLLVVRRNGTSFISTTYNDDYNSGTKLAMLFAPASAGDNLTVYTFSQQRQVDWDCPLQRFPAVNGAWTWEVVQTGAAGGELIDVGASQAGEFIQVQTASGGQGTCTEPGSFCQLNDATSAVLFSVGSANLVPGMTVTTTTPPFFSVPSGRFGCPANPSAYCLGGDARIPAAGTFGWGPQDYSGRNFLLVGKTNVPTSTTPSRNDQVEIHADIVKPPLATQTVSALGHASWGYQLVGDKYWPGYWEALFQTDSGRVTIEVSLKTSRPLGTFADVTSTAPFSPWCGPNRGPGHPCRPVTNGWFASPRNPAPLEDFEPGADNGIDEIDYRWFRGQLQQHGAQVRVYRECQGASGAFMEEAATRDIPLGAFGAYDVFQSFYVTVDNAWGIGNAPGQCRDQTRWWTGRVQVSIDGARDSSVDGAVTSIVTSRSAIRHGRNVDLASFKAAQFNMLYATEEAPAFGASEFYSSNVVDLVDRRSRNTANLLGVRGRAVPAARTVDDPATRGPFEWDADLVTMTEVDSCSQSASFSSEVAATGSSTWFSNCSINEDRDFLVAGYTSNGIVAARDAVNPGCNGAPCGGGRSTGPWFRDSVGSAICRTQWGNSPWVNEEACTLADSGWGSNSVIPARIVVNGEPITVFNVHLRHDNASIRWDEIQSLIETMKAFLQRDPASFNIDGSTLARHAKNRIIIVGDFNASTHDNGEAYWILAKLRQHFGFAIDASMAVEGSVENAAGMHTVLSDGDAGFLAPDGVTWPHQSKPMACMNPGRICATGTGSIPYTSWHQYRLYTPAQTWSDEARYPKAAASTWQSPVTTPHWPLGATNTFPYWAATFRGKEQGATYRTGRYDIYMLVGNGWLADDAVQDYSVMQDTGGENTRYAGAANISPFHNYYQLPSGAKIPVGVEMWGQPDLAREASEGGVENSSPRFPSYTPFRAIYGATTPSGVADAGKPALKTDHKPIGVRLQVRRNFNRDWNEGSGVDPYSFQWTAPN